MSNGQSTSQITVDYDNMTAADFRRERGKRKLSEEQMAAMVGIKGARTIRRIEDGEWTVPESAAYILQLASRHPAIYDVVLRDGLARWQRRVDAGEAEGQKGATNPQPYYVAKEAKRALSDA